MKEIYNNILFLLIGVCVFSSVCSNISIALNAPFTVPEVVLLPFLFLRKEKFRSLKFNRNLFFQYICISIMLICIALLWGIYDIGSIISCARCYIYIFLGICLFDTENSITSTDLMYLCLGSIIGWAVVAYSNLYFLMYEKSDAYITYGMFMSIPMFIALSLSKKDYKIFIIGIIFLTIVFMFAGIRRVIAVFIMSMLFYALLNVIQSPKKLFFIVILFGVLVGVFYMVLPILEEYIRDISPYLYYRIFARFHGAVGNDMDSSDMTRISNLSLLSTTDIDLLFPHGFNTTRYDTVKGSGVFNDVPIFSLAWIFGLPLTMVILFLILIRFLSGYKYYKHYSDPIAIAVLVCVLCMFCLLFLDGTFLTYVYAAPFTGLCIGKLKLFSQKKYAR